MNASNFAFTVAIIDVMAAFIAVSIWAAMSTE
jgi:hypothetical protein